MLSQYCFRKGNYYLNEEGPTKSPKKIWYRGDFHARSAPVIYDNSLYVSIEGAFISLDPKSGELLWEYTIPGQATLPVFKEQYVFFGGCYIDNYVYCLDRNTGEELWKYRTGSNSSNVNRNPIIYKDSLFLVAGKTFHVLNIHTGKKEWSLNLKKRIGYNALIVVNEKAYVVTRHITDNCFLHCIDLNSRKELWKTSIAKLVSDLIYISENLYYLDCNGILYFVDQQTGDLSGTKIIELKREANHLFLASHKGILCIVCDYTIAAIDLTNYKLLWHKHIDGKIGRPVLNNDHVYFGSMGYGIFGLSLQTGEEKFNIKTDVRSKFACGIGLNKLFYAGSMNEHELTAYQ